MDEATLRFLIFRPCRGERQGTAKPSYTSPSLPKDMKMLLALGYFPSIMLQHMIRIPSRTHNSMYIYMDHYSRMLVLIRKMVMSYLPHDSSLGVVHELVIIGQGTE